MKATIEVKDLQQGYGQKTVLNQINLSLMPGKILALIGPSGSGKTTLVNSIMGMLQPQKGTVRVLDQPVPDRQLLSRIGYMAQTDALYQSLSAQENLAFFGALQGLRKQQLQAQINYAAKIVRLNSSLNQLVKNFSGGMKRRLSLAIALLAVPDLLILDEPTVGIDPELRQHIWLELHHLAAQGKTILLTTHVMEDAEQADQILMIRQGAVIAQGKPQELVKKYQVTSIEEVFLTAGRKQDANSGND